MSPYAFRVEMKWSADERKIARRAFDLAYRRQCAAVAEKARGMLARVSDPDGLWKVHDYLSRERKRVDETYDYRYSVLISILARLLDLRWLSGTDLAGLAHDKTGEIERWRKR